MPSLHLAPASTEDYRLLAEKRLPRLLFDYVDGGAYREVTLAENNADFDSLKLKQRVMHDVARLDTTIELLGESWSMPVALAPIGLAGMMARRGEVQAKKAADAVGVPFCLSTVGICSLEEVAKVSERPFWFQLYMLRDRGPVQELLQRAKDVSVTTLVFTVDLAVVGARYRDVRNGMSGGIGLWGKLRSGLLSYLSHPQWLFDVAINGKPHLFGNLADYVPKATTPADFKEWVDSQFDPSVTWKDIEWLRSIWDGNLIIKGVLSPDDALAARRAGADAVIVSNHGGRQLDGVASSISMLPRVVEACGDELDILMDGGVRSGLDVSKALALGAKATLIGRPWIYAVAAKGEAGLTSMLRTFKSEMDVSMALTAARSVADLTPAILDRESGEISRALGRSS
ncbi:MAG: L-lactate dehydrogenase [Gammaproteobacteria bacterium]|nr:L-lactate dehydrogenase [Gammaproteobacteria bacterium]